MWIRFTRKYFAATKKTKLSRVGGQAIMEYLVILLVVTSLFMVIVRPQMAKLQKKMEDSMKKGLFNVDIQGSGFYYFPIK